MQQNKIHRIFIDHDIELNSIIECDNNNVHHIKNVLRIKNNSELIIFNGNGAEYICSIDMNTNNVTLHIKKKLRRKKPDAHKIILAQCIPSLKHMDIAVQKATELGINEIIPIISQRSHTGNHAKKMDHWRKIIIHATEQCNGLILPKLRNIITLEDFNNEKISPNIHKICFHQDGRKLIKKDKLQDTHLVMVGPEGGFTYDEITTLRQKDWNIVTLGDRIFRTETASILAQAILRDY